MHRPATGSLLEQHLCLLANVTSIESLRLLIRQVEQQLRSLLLVMVAHNIWNLQGHRARTLRVRKHVKLGHVQRLQELIGLLKALGRFTPAPYHHINANESIGHLFLDAVNLIAEQAAVVMAVHQLQHRVAATLQGNMEMRHEGTAMGTIVYQLVCEQIGFQ